MIQPFTYRFFAKVTALILLAGILLPTGLYAVSLVDLCMTDMEESAGMTSHGDCHSPENRSDVPLPDHTSHHNCDKSVICTCHIEQAPLPDTFWTTPKSIHIGLLPAIPVISRENRGYFITRLASISVTYENPPLFLLNSTFLN